MIVYLDGSWIRAVLYCAAPVGVLISKVALVRCETYDYAQVLEAVRKGIDLLGGTALFAKPGESILFKPNWLVADPPEKLTTTHPAVFKAMLEVFQSTGAKFFYGDSPVKLR